MDIKDSLGIGNTVKDVIYLTEVDETDSVIVNSIGTFKQMFFSDVNDALYYLFISFKEFTVEKKGDTYIKVKTVTYSDNIKYYILRITEPLKY